MKNAYLVLVGLFVSLQAMAATVKGRVVESATGEPVIGANIIVEDNRLHSVSGLDGSYVIRNVTPGQYRIRISYLTYKTIVKSVTVDQETLTINFSMEPAEDRMLQEVAIVAKRDGASDNTARNLERNASQVMNIVSGKTIQLSPDLTVANVIQRVSGISIERNSNGDGQYAILRGMDKRYNYTLVNGVKIPSPDNRYRYVPLDIFPSELLDRLEVYKALTPSMEGDAVGGAVNMVMKDAPDSPSIVANLSTGYSELFFDRDFMRFQTGQVSKQSPYELFGSQYNATANDFSKATSTYTNSRPAPNLLGGLSIGNRFFNRKLGVIVAGSYQNTYRGSNSLFFDFETVDTLRGVTLTEQNERLYSEQQTRYGIHAKLDYRLSPRHKLQWYNAFMSLTNAQVRDTKSTQLTIGGYDLELGNATLGYSTRSRLTKQQIYTSTLQGEHKLQDNLRLQWSAVYSEATNDVPDNTTIPLLGERKNNVETRTTVGNATRRWEHNSDRDLAGYLNLTYTTSIAGVAVDWMAGGLYRDKQRANFYNNYQLRPTNLLARYGVDFTNYADIAWTVINPRGAVATALTYDASEVIKAGYLQVKTQTQRTEIVGGVRVENTDQGYAMRFQIGEDRPTGKQLYTDVLPSLHVRYIPQERTNLRASYFRSINRPGFFEIVPYRIVQEEYQERGNPDLKRAIADNIDLRYEFFPRPSEQFMVGAFYKRLQNPIEYTLQRDAIRGQDTYYSPGNFGNANNYGLEVDFIKYLNVLGIKANYTYTHSRITTAKSKRIRNQTGDLETITVNQTRPLYGQSAHVANLSLLYKNTESGWDGQLALNYTGDRINTVSQFVDNDLWQKGFVQMDASVEKTFGKGFSFFAKANNLLNTPLEVYIKNTSPKNEGIPFQSEPGQTLVRRDYYQRSYLLGLRYRFQ
ncbi:TonB-dependent receptor plug [Fibrisoma limi BUZ 3]|uniref:TonB-dependent receptor plug n=1 Tax=Fibrisoma limi BUZ 3 TaxID=1185876 RepID=I2GML1_9BACT|nr:TonB-dependent receptor [Fibrisoma limi]CCH55139.1 TonB-dependent receptor plug [Fibrisoma limi BUZ 3]